MSTRSKRRKIPYAHIIMGVAGWIAYPFAQHIGMAIAAGLLTLLAAPRFIRGPREKAEKRVMQRLMRGSVSPARRVRNMLVEQDRSVMELREHPISMLRWWLWGAVWSSLMILVALYPNWGSIVHWQLRWILVTWLVGILPVAIRWMLWYREKIVVTSVRAFVVGGIISRDVSDIPLKTITDNEHIEPWHARLLTWLRLIESEYGHLRIETAGQNDKLRRSFYLPNVAAVKKVILYHTLAD